MEYIFSQLAVNIMWYCRLKSQLVYTVIKGNLITHNSGCTADVMMGKKARKNNAQSKSIDSICQCVYTNNMWRMSKHARLHPSSCHKCFPVTQSIPVHVLLCCHALTSPCVNAAEYMHALPNGIYLMNHGLM